MIRRLLLGAAAVWALLALVLTLAQDHLLYPGAWRLPRDPDTLAALDTLAASRGARVLGLRAQDGTRLMAWHYPAEGRRAVLYVGGNGEGVSASGELASALRREGWDLFVVVLRGFPGSDGRPSADGFASDTLAAWTWLTGPGGFAPNQIVLHGHSMGGGVIGRVMSEVRPGGIVLESTFADLADLASAQYPWLPVRLLLRDRYDTATRAPEITTPTLIVHGEGDRLIPVAHAEQLASAFPRATLAVAQHLDHPERAMLRDANVGEAWIAFLRSVSP